MFHSCVADVRMCWTDSPRDGVCLSDGGADRWHSPGVYRHIGEGERLDGSTHEEESHREGRDSAPSWSFQSFIEKLKLHSCLWSLGGGSKARKHPQV